ncbi:30S ribosomal protein S19 [Candidatus Parcubacteria bacterium]|nr:MAG: 30S ribosomal protein S19 [Candidatus Parcubacteria bacterium]
MSRSLKKPPYVDAKLLKKLSVLRAGTKTIVNTYSRDSMITPEMVGFTIGVHNGRHFIAVSVSEEMVGHRLGEFSPTRKFIKHGGRMQRELEAQAAEKEKAAVEAAKAQTSTETKPAKPAK